MWFCVLRTKQIWYNACYNLWKLAEQHSKAFFHEFQINFFDFFKRNLSGFAGILIREDFFFLQKWPLTSPVLLSISMFLFICLVLWKLTPRDHDFWLQRRLSGSTFRIPPRTLKKPCVQARCSPLRKYLGNVCSEESLIN